MVGGLIKLCYCYENKKMVGGEVASWLVGWSPDLAVWVQALAVDIVLCSWARHFFNYSHSASLHPGV